eukprot:TRINITY_DN14428_c0_g1_i2.p1 TRINITY_DN14428_c0_g1~~TRINITY_DN14428_c0_g1_i2.p1  ORF type:complete len:187 (+),score=21.52 TRINITY_DN14428_c0_g1_i2:2-562(+)
MLERGAHAVTWYLFHASVLANLAFSILISYSWTLEFVALLICIIGNVTALSVYVSFVLGPGWLPRYAVAALLSDAVAILLRPSFFPQGQAGRQLQFLNVSSAIQNSSSDEYTSAFESTEGDTSPEGFSAGFTIIVAVLIAGVGVLVVGNPELRDSVIPERELVERIQATLPSWPLRPRREDMDFTR